MVLLIFDSQTRERCDLLAWYSPVPAPLTQNVFEPNEGDVQNKYWTEKR